MKIKDFIQNEVILPRLKRNGVLVVYDPDDRYRDICHEIENDALKLIDTSAGSIESREKALITLQQLGQLNTKLEGFMVYVPAKAPITEEDKQRDPFALYSVCGNIFPDPESDGDEYMSICLKAKPDQATEIRRIFSENPNPSFSVIDAVGGGMGWPTLQTLLKVESARDIIFSLMAPSKSQLEAIKSLDSWVSEARDLFIRCLGMKLVTRSKSWVPVADELWRFILFSEFVFDLPVNLPDSLSNVPRAAVEARLLIEDLCERLRNDQRTQALYIDRAEAIERELDLPGHCDGIKDLGIRDTFPFEERCFIDQAKDALRANDTDAARPIVGRHDQSVWVGKGEIKSQWILMRAALNLCEACDDFERQLPDYSRTQESLINYYIGSLREADRIHREFEQFVSDYIDSYTFMGDVIQKARSRYRGLIAKVQDIFIKHLEKSGWPPSDRLCNADIFDSIIAPQLKESGRRVAFFLTDALRYELGVVLEQELSSDGQIELQASYAQLPSITSVGMASLLPEAGKSLHLQKRDDDIVPALGDIVLSTITQRIDVLKQRYGQRFNEMTLDNFLKLRDPIPGTVEFMVLRSQTIDANMEKTPELALELIHKTLKRIRVAINKLKTMGFQLAVIATDHGFFLNTCAEAGDVATKPPGNWINIHDRFQLGDGTSDAANFVLPSEQLGIRGEFAQAAGPRGLVPYRAGVVYFHGGASLQECILPVITLRLEAERHEYKKPMVVFSYKSGAKTITTRLPVLDVLLDVQDLFLQGEDFEILLEAHDKKGNVVGEAKAGGPVNPATGTVVLKPGERIQVTLKMDPEFEGKFTVKALNPTNMTVYCKIDLETDYVV